VKETTIEAKKAAEKAASAGEVARGIASTAD
jgi:hypothetical protein